MGDRELRIEYWETDGQLNREQIEWLVDNTSRSVDESWYILGYHLRALLQVHPITVLAKKLISWFGRE